MSIEVAHNYVHTGAFGEELSLRFLLPRGVQGVQECCQQSSK
jgi:hypothetical protein